MWWRLNKERWQIQLHRDHAAAFNLADSGVGKEALRVQAESAAQALHALLPNLPSDASLQIVLGIDVARLWLLQGAADLREKDWMLLAGAAWRDTHSSVNEEAFHCLSIVCARSESYRMVLSFDMEVAQALQTIPEEGRTIESVTAASALTLGSNLRQDGRRPCVLACTDGSGWAIGVLNGAGWFGVATYPQSTSREQIQQEALRQITEYALPQDTRVSITESAGVLTFSDSPGLMFDPLARRQARGRRNFLISIAVFVFAVAFASYMLWQRQQILHDLQTLQAQRDELASAAQALDRKGIATSINGTTPQQISKDLNELSQSLSTLRGTYLDGFLVREDGSLEAVLVLEDKLDDKDVSALLARLSVAGWRVTTMTISAEDNERHITAIKGV